jgi:hypothetical protein
MGKETSTDEKQSAREARHSERLERITKRDADNSQTNDDSKDVPDGSLSVNAADAPLSAFASRPPELQANQQKQREEREGRGKRASPRDAWSLALASADEMHHPHELQGIHRQERKGSEVRETNEEEDASSDEDIKPGAVSVAGVFTGPKESPLHRDKAPSLIIAKLARFCYSISIGAHTGVVAPGY